MHTLNINPAAEQVRGDEQGEREGGREKGREGGRERKAYRGEIVVDHDVDTLNVDPAAEQVRGDEQALLPVLEGVVLLDAGGEGEGGREGGREVSGWQDAVNLKENKGVQIPIPSLPPSLPPSLHSYRSSWFMPPWMQMEGKLQSTRSLFKALARFT